MLTIAVSGVLALAALVCFALAVGLVRRYPPAGIALAALIIVPLWEVPSPPVLVSLAGLNITLADVVTLILFVVGALEFRQLGTNLQGWLIPWLFLGVWIALSVLRGAVTFGLGSATNEARGVLWVYFVMTWGFAIRTCRLKLHTASLVLGWVLVLVAIYHGVVFGVGDPSSISVGPDGLIRTNRILVAGQAAALLLCAGMVFLRRAELGKSRARYVWSSFAFLGVVLLSQHRSVWVAGLVGMTAVLIFATGGLARRRAFALIAVGAWIAFIGWTLQGSSSEFFDSALSSNTFDWRTSGWQTLVSDAIARGPVTVVIGEPFGSGFVRTVISGVATGVKPHNWYVEIFLRLGIIGLALFSWMLITALFKSRERSSEWMFALTAVGVYAFAYAVDWFLAPWLAAAMVVSFAGRNGADQALESRTSKTAVAGQVGKAPVPKKVRHHQSPAL